MRQHLREEMGVMRTELCVMRNILKAMVAIGMTLVPAIIVGYFVWVDVVCGSMVAILGF